MAGSIHFDFKANQTIKIVCPKLVGSIPLKSNQFLVSLEGLQYRTQPYPFQGSHCNSDRA